MTEGNQEARILIADDSELIVDLIRAMLERSGFRALFAAHSGKAALAKAAEVQPDLILLDVGMPDLDGYEVARRLRAMAWTRQPGIIIQTGKDSPEESRLAREAGADEIIFKPLNRARLVEAVQRQLQAAR